jgi:molecular chaperone HscB
LFDQGEHALATDRVRRLMFLEKLLYEIDDALASLED